ncbi:UNVERIFIED_CONTAM: hypothetical protein GTU68_027494 [Idotea baltica]|nr:hypothetical protein [Idotea baltica]
MGCLSSLETYQYPLFMEARVRLADCTLANNIWMLSADSTEEIDMMETYPSSRASSDWLDQRMHLSHHVFIRQPFQDYQPRDEEGVFGTWYRENGRADWRDEWVRMGLYWVDPWHLEYYINGQLIENTTTFDAIDKYNYTNGTGLSKPMHIIVNMEQQSWLTTLGTIPSESELDDASDQNTFFIDWIRVYKAVVPSSILGDVNEDGMVSFLDIAPFIVLLSSGVTSAAADINEDELVNFLDIAPFIELLSSGA